MEIRKPKSQESAYIYSAILKFTKGKNGHVSENVHIVIRYYRKGGKRKKDLPIPKEIKTENLEWKKYKGEGICVYRRTGNGENYDYVDSRGINAPTGLVQKLEDLVKEACFGNSNKTKYII